MSNGKGDVPRNCFSKKFKDNYDSINWGRNKTIGGKVQCPNSACENGVVDTGGFTPWDTPIFDKCNICNSDV